MSVVGAPGARRRIRLPGTRPVDGALLVALLLGVALSLMRFNTFQVGTFYDDAQYIILAESIATGQGFGLINYPYHQPELNFPPGLPLLLAPVVARDPTNHVPLKLLSTLFNLGSVVLASALLRDRLPQGPSRRLLPLLIATQPAFVGTSGMVLSEPVYLFLTLLAMILFDRWQRRGGPLGLNPWLAPLAIVVVVAWATRTVGVTLMAALVGWLVLHRRFRHGTVLAAALAILMLPLLWFNALRGGLVMSVGYRQQIAAADPSALLSHVYANVSTYLHGVLAGIILPVFDWSGTVVPTPGHFRPSLLDLTGLSPVAGPLNAAVLAILALGFVGGLRKPQPDHLYAVVYGVALALFAGHVPVQPRFLMALMPFLMLYFLEGWSRVAAAVSKVSGAGAASQRTGVGALGVAVVVVAVAANLREVAAPLREDLLDIAVGSTWIRDHAAPDAVVMTRDPRPRYLYVRRRTIDFADGKTEADTLERIDEYGVDYVIVSPPLAWPKTDELDEFVAATVEPLVNSHPQLFTAVFSRTEDNVTVYRVEAGG